MFISKWCCGGESWARAPTAPTCWAVVTVNIWTTKWVLVLCRSPGDTLSKIVFVCTGCGLIWESSGFKGPCIGEKHVGTVNLGSCLVSLTTAVEKDLVSSEVKKGSHPVSWWVGRSKTGFSKEAWYPGNMSKCGWVGSSAITAASGKEIWTEATWHCVSWKRGRKTWGESDP